MDTHHPNENRIRELLALEAEVFPVHTGGLLEARNEMQALFGTRLMMELNQADLAKYENYLRQSL